jgi:hypothetical protein
VVEEFVAPSKLLPVRFVSVVRLDEEGELFSRLLELVALNGLFSRLLELVVADGLFKRLLEVLAAEGRAPVPVVIDVPVPGMSPVAVPVLVAAPLVGVIPRVAPLGVEVVCGIGPVVLAVPDVERIFAPLARPVPLPLAAAGCKPAPDPRAPPPTPNKVLELSSLELVAA